MLFSCTDNCNKYLLHNESTLCNRNSYVVYIDPFLQ